MRETLENQLKYEWNQKFAEPRTAPQKQIDPSSYSTALPKTLDAEVKALIYALSMIALGVKLAQSQGKLNPKLISQFWKRFSVPNISVIELNQLFESAETDQMPIDYHVKRIERLYSDVPSLFYESTAVFLDTLCEGDRMPKAEEIALIEEIAFGFGINKQELTHLLTEKMVPSEAAAHKILKVKRGVHKALLKQIYRERIRDCHPDTLGKKATELYKIIAKERFDKLTNAYNSLNNNKKINFIPMGQ